MRLELLAKDSNSGEFGCPSVHLDLDDPEFVVVQSDVVDTAQLPNALPGEGGVRIRADIVLEATRRLRQR